MKLEGNMEYFTQRLKCNFNDKMQAIEVVKKLVRYGQLARRSGLLSLEREFADEEDLFLKKGLSLVVDARPTEQIRDTLDAFIVAGNYKGAEFLKRIVAAEGVIFIQNGVNPMFIVDLLEGWFGEDFILIYEDEMELFMTQETKKMQDRNTVGDLLGQGEVSLVPDFDRLNFLDFNSVLKLVKNINVTDLSIALKGAGKRVAWFLYDSLSFRKQDLILSEFEYISKMEDNVVRLAQEKIVDVAKKMEQNGEIVFTDENKTTDIEATLGIKLPPNLPS